MTQEERLQTEQQATSSDIEVDDIKLESDSIPSNDKKKSFITAIISITVSIVILIAGEIIFSTIEVSEARPGVINPDNNQKLVYLTGSIKAESFEDPMFSIKADGLALERLVEMYQWVDVDGEYVGQWQSELVDISSEEAKSKGISNPPEMPFFSEKWSANEVKIGIFTISDSLAKSILKPEQLVITQQDFNKLNEYGQKAFKLYEGKYFFGINPSEPRIGDLMVSFYAVKPNEVTILAKQIGNTLTDYRTEDGLISRAETGKLTLKEVSKGLDLEENSIFIWIARLLSIVIFILGGITLIKSLLQKNKPNNIEQNNKLIEDEISSLPNTISDDNNDDENLSPSDPQEISSGEEFFSNVAKTENDFEPVEENDSFEEDKQTSAHDDITIDEDLAPIKQPEINEDYLPEENPQTDSLDGEFEHNEEIENSDESEMPEGIEILSEDDDGIITEENSSSDDGSDDDFEPEIITEDEDDNHSEAPMMGQPPYSGHEVPDLPPPPGLSSNEPEDSETDEDNFETIEDLPEPLEFEAEAQDEATEPEDSETDEDNFETIEDLPEPLEFEAEAQDETTEPEDSETDEDNFETIEDLPEPLEFEAEAQDEATEPEDSETDEDNFETIEDLPEPLEFEANARNAKAEALLVEAQSYIEQINGEAEDSEQDDNFDIPNIPDDFDPTAEMASEKVDDNTQEDKAENEDTDESFDIQNDELDDLSDFNIDNEEVEFNADEISPFDLSNDDDENDFTIENDDKKE